MSSTVPDRARALESASGPVWIGGGGFLELIGEDCRCNGMSAADLPGETSAVRWREIPPRDRERAGSNRDAGDEIPRRASRGDEDPRTGSWWWTGANTRLCRRRRGPAGLTTRPVEAAQRPSRSDRRRRRQGGGGGGRKGGKGQQGTLYASGAPCELFRARDGRRGRLRAGRSLGRCERDESACSRSQAVCARRTRSVHAPGRLKLAIGASNGLQAGARGRQSRSNAGNYKLEPAAERVRPKLGKSAATPPEKTLQRQDFERAMKRRT